MNTKEYNRIKNIGFKCGSDFIIDENCNEEWHLKELEIIPNSPEEQAFKAGWAKAMSLYIQ